MDSAELELFEASLRRATQTHTGGALDTALTEVGWHDALAIDPRAAVSKLFELQGRANATSCALEAVIIHALASTAEGVVLPALGSRRAPATPAGDGFVVDGLALAQHDRVLVVAEAGGRATAAVVSPLPLDARPIRGIDPSLGLLQVRGEIDLADALPVDWAAAVASGQRAVAHELIGVSRTMLELARDHAIEREQFGRPIAMFQAIRHRLADTFVAIETADAALDAAWEDESVLTAAMAKALAGRGARSSARHCQQVLAGIGFTTEHSLHGYIRRALVLDQLLGSASTLTAELGTNLLATRQLPTPLPL